MSIMVSVVTQLTDYRIRKCKEYQNRVGIIYTISMNCFGHILL